MKWVKVQEVNVIVEGPFPGYKSVEDGIVLEVTKEGVWLDNGEGNDPSGPFNIKTGIHIDSRTVHPQIEHRIEKTK